MSISIDNRSVRLAKSSVLSADLCDAFFVISVQEHLGDEDVLAAFSTLIIASNPKVLRSLFNLLVVLMLLVLL